MYLICSNNVKGYLNTEFNFTEDEKSAVKFTSLADALFYLQEKRFFNCYPLLIEEKKISVKKIVKKTAKKAVKKRK